MSFIVLLLSLSFIVLNPGRSDADQSWIAENELLAVRAFLNKSKELLEGSLFFVGADIAICGSPSYGMVKRDKDGVWRIDLSRLRIPTRNNVSKTLRFSGMSMELPDGWFEIRTRDVDIRSYLKFTDAKRTAVEPIDMADREHPHETFNNLTFACKSGIKPQYFGRRLAAYRKWDLDNGYGTLLSPVELQQHGGRQWTCWEVKIPPRRYGPVEFTSCNGHVLVGKPEDLEHVLWRVSASGPSTLAAVIRESLSFALSNLSFSS